MKKLGLGKSKKDKEAKKAAEEKKYTKEELMESDSPPSDNDDGSLFAPVNRAKAESLSLQPGDPLLAQMQAAERRKEEKDMAFKLPEKKSSKFTA